MVTHPTGFWVGIKMTRTAASTPRMTRSAPVIFVKEKPPRLGIVVILVLTSSGPHSCSCRASRFWIPNTGAWQAGFGLTGGAGENRLG